MMSWVRPVEYDSGDGRVNSQSIIMNRENTYEYGLSASTGALMAAFSPCWRWSGTVLVPQHEWTHTAYGYDGESQNAFVSGTKVESDPCGAPGGSLGPHDSAAYPGFRIGSRSWQGWNAIFNSGPSCRRLSGPLFSIANSY